MTFGTRFFAGFVLLVSAAVLGTALLSQYWGGLAPCELCLYQRGPWAIAIVAAIVALLAGGPRALPWLALLFAAVFAVSAVLAFYHVAVEHHWIAGPTSCTAPAGGAANVEDLKRQILGQAPVLCDRVAWSLWGISMAGWNCIASIVMAGVCASVFRQSVPRRART
jgi:disulfide bond formation protein DsbB